MPKTTTTSVQPENKVCAVFAYDLAAIFRSEAELYKKKYEEALKKLQYYKQHSIY